MKTAAAFMKALRDPDLVLTRSEITEAWNELKNRADRIEREAVMAWRVGDKAEFTSRNRNFPGVQEGVITAINQKTVKLKSTKGINWTVTPSVLRKVA